MDVATKAVTKIPKLPSLQIDEMDEVCDSIKQDTYLVFKLSNIMGTFPYNVRSLKLSKFFCLWSVIVFGTIFRLLSITYMGLKIKTEQKMEFYNVLMIRFLLIALFTVCTVLFYSLFTIRKNLKAIFLELNRIQSYFTQLSCLDAASK